MHAVFLHEAGSAFWFCRRWLSLQQAPRRGDLRLTDVSHQSNGLTPESSVMPRLDAARVQAWRDMQSIVSEIERRIDDDLRAEWAVPLGWFDVLATLRQLDGRARPQDVA